MTLLFQCVRDINQLILLFLEYRKTLNKFQENILGSCKIKL